MNLIKALVKLWWYEMKYLVTGDYIWKSVANNYAVYINQRIAFDSIGGL